MSKLQKTLCLLIFVFQSVFAQELKEAFQTLKIYDYFKAKKMFEQLLSENIVGANYGLSIIYSRNDNPFYNIDSAIKHIKTVQNEYKKLTNKQKIQLLEFDIDIKKLKQHYHKIINTIYENVKKSANINRLEDFAIKFPKSSYLSELNKLLEKLYFQKAQKENSRNAYREFIIRFPNSKNSKIAKQFYEKLLFTQKIKQGDILSYRDFIRQYPKSPYIKIAKDSIFKIATKSKKIRDYEKFIKKFPKHHKINDLWNEIYKREIIYNSKKEFKQFIKKYPKYPKIDKVKEKEILYHSVYYPILKNKKYGFINDIGRQITKPQYLFVGDFHNELALVANQEKVGYINKLGELEIPFKFDEGEDFKYGLAVVDINEKYGVIDINGDFVLPCQYDKISISEHFISVKKNDYYQYYSHLGQVEFLEKFTYAGDHIHSRAIVTKENKYGLVDENLEWIIPCKYKHILPLVGEQLFVGVTMKNEYILFSKKGKKLSKLYHYIGNLLGGRIIFSNGKKYGYLNAKGKEVVDAKYSVFDRYEQVANFQNKYALSSYKGKYGLVDKNGKRILKNRYKKLKSSNLDLIPVMNRQNKWGYVNTKNTLKIRYKYQDAESFKGKYAIVKFKNKYGLIDTKGKLKLLFIYDKLEWFENGWLLNKKANELGILDIENDKIIIPNKYVNIKFISDKIIKLYTKNSIHYYDLRLKEFLYKD